MAEEEKYAAADLATAQEQKNAIIKYLADLEEKGVDFANKKTLQDEAAKARAEEADKQRKHDTAENAKRNTATVEAARIRANYRDANKKEDIIEFGDFYIKGAKESNLNGLYYYLLDNSNIKPVQQLDQNGMPIEDKEVPTSTEIKAWIRKNRKALLPLLQEWADNRGYEFTEGNPKAEEYKTTGNVSIGWE
jgi:hypothetical protein